MSTSSLTQALVRILEHDREPREPIGAGFLVTSRHLLTCAHVVASALRIEENTPERPTQPVYVDFPLLERHPILKAQVINWYPVKEHPSVGEPEDIAVLELTSKPPLPKVAQPISIVKLDDDMFFDRAVRMCGFPRGMDDGDWMTGTLQGITASGRVQLDNESGRRAVAKGFSGTAVWDKQENAVAGMIVGIQRRDRDTPAYMIPASTLLKAWPELDQHSRPPNPYQGLQAFREQDASYFFGRDEVIQGLQQKIQDHHFVTVIGASGSGKSSLIFAGLVPELRKEEGWIIASLRPKNNPFEQLALTLISFLYSDKLKQAEKLKECAQKLKDETINLSQIAQLIMQDHPGKRLLLIIDQFEELYTLNSDKALQCQFIDRLLQSAQPQGQLPDFTMLTAIRADFMGQAVSYGAFAEVLNTYPVEILKQMDEKELISAIEQPAQKMGVVIQQGLTERILQDLGQEPGNLPLLEFALTQLWERQTYRKLTHAAYTDIGGVNKALAHHADEVYSRFDATQQENLRRVLVQLVRPGEGTEDTRQMATRNQIRAENWNLVTELANARLVVTGRNEETGEETVEVVHEALIQHWQPLREWIKADREFRMWQERLRSEMRQWHTSNHDEGALLRGAPLAEAENWLEQRGENLSQKEQQFIEMGLQLRDREHVEREAQQQHELELSRKIAQEQRQRAEEKEKAARKLRSRLFVATVLAIIAIAAAIGAFYGFRQANEQKEIAEQERNKAEVNAIEALNQTSKALFLTHDELGALLAGVKAGVKVKHIKTPTTSKLQTVANLSECIESIYEQNRLHVHTKALEGLAFSPDGSRLASASSEDGTIRLWELATGTELVTFSGHTGFVESVAFSPDGTQLASGSKDRTIKLWNATAGTELATFSGHTGTVMSVAFSPDGTRLASGSWDTTIRLWDLDLDDLLMHGCEWLHGYLKTNPNVSEEDRSLCDDILRNEPRENKLARQAQKEFQSRMTWGKIYMAQRHYEKAMTSYHQAKEIKPENQEVWLKLGIAHDKLGHENQALESYRKALEMHPAYEDAWYNLLYALYKQGKLQEAHADFQKLLEIDPTHRFALSIMDNVGNDLKVAAYQTLLEVEPDHEEIAFNMVTIGVAFWKQGKFDEAGIAWEAVAIARANTLQERPNDLSLLRNDAELALLQNDIPRCQKRIATAMQTVKPDNGLFIILPFLAWLADPEEEDPQKVLTAFNELEPGILLRLDFSNIEPAIARQDEETQKIARLFIDFFEGKVDLPTLKARLAEHEKTE